MKEPKFNTLRPWKCLPSVRQVDVGKGGELRVGVRSERPLGLQGLGLVQSPIFEVNIVSFLKGLVFSISMKHGE